MVNLLTVKNLSYKYKNSSDYAIKNISFSAEKGDMIALIGKSGSGKTTIINSTLGLFSNIEGEVSFGEGVSVRDVDYCMQNQSVDWYLNVYDNIYMINFSLLIDLPSNSLLPILRFPFNYFLEKVDLQIQINLQLFNM